jgi:FkbM family methyltransferase
MLLNLDNLIEKYDLHIKNVIHVGGHVGQEIDVYVRNNVQEVVFFEPQPHAFKALEAKCEKFRDVIKTVPHNVALGNETGRIPMHIERKNGGQSSSILKPKQHLVDYPDIKFEGTIDVIMTKLDNVINDKYKYDLINIDVQGYELEVFRGSQEILPNIKYIYAEVNFCEMYEGNVLACDLDNFLSKFGFIPIETGELVNGHWSDRLYMNTKFVPKYANQVSVPNKFLQRPNNLYPNDNTICFEKWFETVFFKGQDTSGRHYLPVNWTAHYTNNGYGKEKVSLDRLQSYIDSLSRKKKYFTIVQYDDGILNDISDLDIVVFSSGGRVKNINSVKNVIIPLMGMDHKFHLGGREKDLLVSFVGKDTHPCRTKLLGTKGYGGDVLITSSDMEISSYCKILARSKFVLAPRGYGATSFRIWEALQYGAIPIYISDDHLLPFGESFYMLKFGLDIDYGELIQYLRENESMLSKQFKYLKHGAKYEIFNYSATANRIIETLKNY